MDRLWWDVDEVGRAANKAAVDIFHGTSFLVPRGLNMPAVVTFFDLAFLRHPGFYSLKENIYLRLVIRHSVKSARAVITISEFSKQEICSLMNVESSKIWAIPLGVRDINKASRVSAEALLKRYDLKEPYLITVSTVTTRKNLEVLFSALKSLGKGERKNIKLCIAGREGFGAEAIKKKCSDLSLNNKVIFTGPIPQQELDMLLSRASIALVPSKYEGFGLPVLEAMGAGVPVIAADSSALPEVVGQAGLLVDPDRPEEWAEKITAVLDEGNLRDKMIREGLERVENFSWDTTAAKTKEVYERIRD
jgi:alpha-1,3-rhamnosyl/mannosyltransferase